MDKKSVFVYIWHKFEMSQDKENRSMAWMNEEGRPFDSALLEREPQIRQDLKEKTGSQGGTEEPRPRPEDIRPQSSRYLAG